MKKQKSNNYLIIANLSAFLYFFIGHFVVIPDFVKGVCIGLSIALYPIGLYAVNHDISKLQRFKKNLVGKLAK